MCGRAILRPAATPGALSAPVPLQIEQVQGLKSEGALSKRAHLNLAAMPGPEPLDEDFEAQRTAWRAGTSAHTRGAGACIEVEKCKRLWSCGDKG
jgi:hypothetical protein